MPFRNLGLGVDRFGNQLFNW